MAQVNYFTGLPADLNRLRKEQLIAELENRGCFSQNMKSLKKDLIDTLRALLAEERQQQSQDGHVEESISTAYEAICAVEQPPELPAPSIGCSMESDTLLPTTFPTRSSILSSMRTSLSVNEVSVESEEEKATRIASEFEARQSRANGRQSTASAAVAGVPDQAVEQGDDDMQCIPDVETVLVPEPPIITEQTTTLVSAAANLVILEEVKPSFVSPERKAFQPFDISVVSETEASTSEVQQLFTDTKAIVDDDCMVISPAKSVEIISSDGDISADSSPVSLSSRGDNSVPVESVPAPSVAQQSTALPLKKPMNLVSSVQTSFLPGTKPKPLVPALQQAAKLKDLEAAKALQREAERKRKETEKKTAATTATTAKAPAAPTSTVGLSGLGFGSMRPATTVSGTSGLIKPVYSSLPIKTVSAGTTAISGSAPRTLTSQAPAAAAAAAAKPAKTGILGLLKKTFTPSKPVAAREEEQAPAIVETTQTTSVECAVSKNLFNSSTVESSLSVAPAPPSQPSVQPPVVFQEKKDEVAISPEKSVEYTIDDCDTSGSDSGTDDEDKEDRKKNQIPAWARGTELKEALERQFGFHKHIPPVDPDTIFFEVHTCSLEEIFGQKEGRAGDRREYSKRTSSAKWDSDELSLVEKRKYRKEMGYAVATPTTLAL